MNKVVFYFGNWKIEYMYYVGLSCIRKLDDVYILELNEKKIIVFMYVIEEMDRLRVDFMLYFCVLILKDIFEDIKIVYYNIRFFYMYI